MMESDNHETIIMVLYSFRNHILLFLHDVTADKGGNYVLQTYTYGLNSDSFTIRISEEANGMHVFTVSAAACCYTPVSNISRPLCRALHAAAAAPQPCIFLSCRFKKPVGAQRPQQLITWFFSCDNPDRKEKPFWLPAELLAAVMTDYCCFGTEGPTARREMELS